MQQLATLPPLDALATTAEKLAGIALEADDRRAFNALNKAIWHLTAGLEILPTTGGWLIPSGTRGGVVHRFSSSHGCSCEAGTAGLPCWHASVAEIIQAAQERAERTVSYDEAMAAMAELFA